MFPPLGRFCCAEPSNGCGLSVRLTIGLCPRRLHACARGGSRARAVCNRAYCLPACSPACLPGPLRACACVHPCLGACAPACRAACARTRVRTCFPSVRPLLLPLPPPPLLLSASSLLPPPRQIVVGVDGPIVPQDCSPVSVDASLTRPHTQRIAAAVRQFFPASPFASDLVPGRRTTEGRCFSRAMGHGAWGMGVHRAEVFYEPPPPPLCGAWAEGRTVRAPSSTTTRGLSLQRSSLSAPRARVPPASSPAPLPCCLSTTSRPRLSGDFDLHRRGVGGNYWAPLPRKRHIPPHPAQPRYTNDGALRTRKRHQQEHRPQRPDATCEGENG